MDVGVRFGSYDEPGGCRIEWWLKKGELMVCISLLGSAGEPSDEGSSAASELWH
jgi:hypothetical protein